MHPLIIPFMSLIARAAGDDWFELKFVWGMLFALPFAYVSYSIHNSYLMAIILYVICWRAYEAGHGTFYGMNGYHDHNSETGKPRIQTLEKIFRPLYVWLGGDIMHPVYSWYMMGLKGFLIGLPLGWYALALAVLWPSAYWLGRRYEKSGAVAEYLSGMAAGTVILMAIGV